MIPHELRLNLSVNMEMRFYELSFAICKPGSQSQCANHCTIPYQRLKSFGLTNDSFFEEQASEIEQFSLSMIRHRLFRCQICDNGWCGVLEKAGEMLIIERYSHRAEFKVENMNESSFFFFCWPRP
jgi:hypothetical protein